MSLITEINDVSQFSELRHTWNSLLERCRDKNVFLTWEYLSVYWKHFGKGKKLRILTAESDGEIIAIAPLRQTRHSPWGILGYDVVEPMACNQADYTGLILAEKETEVFNSFFDYLIGTGDWDFIYLFDFPGETVGSRSVLHLHKTLPASELVEGAVCPYISVPDSVDLLMNRYDGRYRKNIRRCMKNLQKDYGRVELTDSSEFGSTGKAMEMFFRLHQKRWATKGEVAVFNTQLARKKREFHFELAELFADKGWLALYFLTINGEPVAASYNYTYNRKMYNVVGGFDPRYSKYSVGSLLLVKTLEKCVEKGINEYDLMKGDEPYKFKWTKTTRTNVNVIFVNHKLTSSLYGWGIRVAKRIGIGKIMEKFIPFH